MPITHADDEVALLCDALEVSPRDVRLRHREPLGDGSVAGFDVGAGPGGSPGGTTATVFVDTSRLAVGAETGMRHPDGARLWTHPADPHLPALAPVAFAESAAVLLSRLGVDVAGAPEMVGYRPGRRAVLRVPTADGTVWVKVVPPRRAEHIAALHALLRRRALPVPAVRAWSPQGLLILDAADGRPALGWTGHAAVLLDGVDELRARVGAVDFATPARTSIATRAAWYADRIRRAMPGERAVTEALAVLVPSDSGGGRDPDGATAGIHGDLHLGQLFVDEATGAVTGLIDIDTAGTGEPSDDAAAFIAHALASAELSDRPAAVRLREIAALGLDRWAVRPAERRRVGVHLLGHALSAADAGDTARARALLWSARDLAEITTSKGPLTDASSTT